MTDTKTTLDEIPTNFIFSCGYKNNKNAKKVLQRSKYHIEICLYMDLAIKYLKFYIRILIECDGNTNIFWHNTNSCSISARINYITTITKSNILH